MFSHWAAGYGACSDVGGASAELGSGWIPCRGVLLDTEDQYVEFISLMQRGPPAPGLQPRAARMLRTAAAEAARDVQGQSMMALQQRSAGRARVGAYAVEGGAMGSSGSPADMPDRPVPVPPAAVAHPLRGRLVLRCRGGRGSSRNPLNATRPGPMGGWGSRPTNQTRARPSRCGQCGAVCQPPLPCPMCQRPFCSRCLGDHMANHGRVQTHRLPQDPSPSPESPVELISVSSDSNSTPEETGYHRPRGRDRARTRRSKLVGPKRRRLS